MAKITDKFFNRIIEGKLVTDSDDELVSAKVENIENISSETLNKLKAGDIVAKKTGNQWHAYIVSYKGNGAGEGLCLTYTDASVVETVSYDRSGDGWVYNSTDVSPISLESFENKDLVVKTIKQKQANYSVDIDTFPNLTNGTSSPIFCRVQQLNQELHVVFMGKIVNETENNITGTGTTEIDVDLPEEIADKIYDVLGNKVSDAIGSAVRVSGSYAFGSADTGFSSSSNIHMFIMNKQAKNRLSISFVRNGGFTIVSGQTLYLEGRVSLDLI